VLSTFALCHSTNLFCNSSVLCDFVKGERLGLRRSEGEWKEALLNQGLSFAILHVYWLVTFDYPEGLKKMQSSEHSKMRPIMGGGNSFQQKQFKNYKREKEKEEKEENIYTPN
jgi:hypothetical protein